MIDLRSFDIVGLWKGIISSIYNFILYKPMLWFINLPDWIKYCFYGFLLLCSIIILFFVWKYRKDWMYR